MKALLFSAGLGTRLKPFTDHHPKALARIGNSTLLEWNIRWLQQFGIFDVVVNVHHFADQIIELLSREQGFGSQITISDERDALLETGGGLKKAAPFFAGQQDLLVLNVDILSNTDISELIHAHRSQGAIATLAVQQRTSSRYFLFDKYNCLKGWENPQKSALRLAEGAERPELKARAFSGIQVIDQALLHKIPFEGKFSIVDVYLDLCGREKIMAWDHTGDQLLDVGKPESLELATKLFGAR